jgi:hypothetical protein
MELIFQLSPASRHFITFRPKYSQHAVKIMVNADSLDFISSRDKEALLPHKVHTGDGAYRQSG